MTRERIKFGGYSIGLWCNHSLTEPCERSPTTWCYFTGAYYARCDLHKGHYQWRDEVFNSLDDVKADIAMREL